MLISEQMPYLHPSQVLLRESHTDSPETSIPTRYRNGRGGINLEQVKHDQRRARNEVVRAMLQRIGKRFRRA